MCAVRNMAVFFNISLIFCFPGMLLRYCLSDFEIVPVSPCNYQYHFCFHIPRELNFYCEVFIFQNLLTFFLDHISGSRNCNIYYHACPPLPLTFLKSRIKMSGLHLFIIIFTTTTTII